MLKMGGVISRFFQLVLGVFFKLVLNAINKYLKVLEVFLEKGFEFWPRDWSNAFVAALVLGLSEIDGATKECGGK